MPPSHQTFRLFDLPPELRLDIYRQCSAFTLLQLSHSHPHFRTEINANPSVYKTAFGFLPSRTLTPTLKLLLMPQREYPKYQWRIRNAKKEGTEAGETLSLYMVERVQDLEERKMFLELYGGRHPGVKCCETCLRIRLEFREAVLVEGHPMPERESNTGLGCCFVFLKAPDSEGSFIVGL
ncbi:hypothetical protein BJ508DRAFT_329314 [Ascobolus immersus RN42]|uniref:F-box domain-containing protein n=1 Tax=Ascobolus immersus RN42 TaxID=1160509 RepID=A0A3N4HWY2_ASCIM|nr:hypothetical protein BJ508DRAFT_329314 [Ascobolus immersus RN42]